MMLLRFTRWLMCIAAVLVTAMGPTQASAAGLIILEGSDAQTFHRLDPYSTAFLTGLATFSSAPTLPILAVDTSSSPIGTPPTGIVILPTIPSLATLLSTYSGLYIQSPGTCCDENDAAILGHEADVRAFVAAGRSLAIEDYQGGAAFDSVLGFSPTTDGLASLVVGLGSGLGTGLGGCFDGNVVAPAGSAFGLGPVGSAIPNIGCFGHQAYLASYFDAKGFIFHIADNPGLPGFNVVISNGGGGLAEATPGVPEPASIALLIVGLAGIAVVRHLRRSA